MYFPLPQSYLYTRELHGKRLHPDVPGRRGAVRVRLLYGRRAVRAARCVRVQVLQARAPAARMQVVRATAVCGSVRVPNPQAITVGKAAAG